MAKLSPIPYRIPMLDRNGRVTRSWQQWFQALLDRTGGTGDVATNAELHSETELSLGAQTSTFIVQLLRQFDDVQMIPALSFIVPDTLDLSAPLATLPMDGLGLEPRLEASMQDFTLGTMPGGSL